MFELASVIVQWDFSGVLRIVKIRASLINPNTRRAQCKSGFRETKIRNREYNDITKWPIAEFALGTPLELKSDLSKIVPERRGSPWSWVSVLLLNTGLLLIEDDRERDSATVFP